MLSARERNSWFDKFKNFDNFNKLNNFDNFDNFDNLVLFKKFYPTTKLVE